MIEINLLPEELKKKRRKIELPDIAFLPIIAGLLGIIIVTHLSLGLAVTLKARTLKRLQAKWEEILPDKEKADELKYELTAMRDKIEAIEELVEGRLSWAKKLSDLSDAMIAGVWLSRLWLEKKVILQDVEVGGDKESSAPEFRKTIIESLHLNGSVFTAGGEETAAVGKFIRSLKVNRGFFYDFKEIETASIQRTKLEESEVMDFELICHFK